nr:exosortase J [Reyranella sp.]
MASINERKVLPPSTSPVRPRKESDVWQWSAFAACCGGAACFSFQLAGLWHMWTTDGLRSIGILSIPISLVLSWRVLRRCPWGNGSWWGLALMALSMALGLGLSRISGRVGYVAQNVGLINFVPSGLLLFLYASGAVVFLWGVAAWRRAAFPIALLLLVNPLPLVNTMVDLPLQQLGARVAWAFARLLGVPINGDPEDLWLYFAPGFGMFIAPACNGLRSAVTLGCVALVAGYLYRLTIAAHALYIIGNVLFAFVLNGVRLCVLVVLNAVSLHVPFLYRALEREAEWIDYILYIPMFFVAGLFMFGIARRLRQSGRRPV